VDSVGACRGKDAAQDWFDLAGEGASSRRRMMVKVLAIYYHVMSKTVNDKILFGSTEKKACFKSFGRA